MYNNYNSYGTGFNNTFDRSESNIMGQMDEIAAVALLQHLGKEDLQHLLNDDSKLSDLIQDLNQVRNVQLEHDAIVAQNKSLAEYNLSVRPKLDLLKTEVASGYETVNKLKTELGFSKARLDEFLNNQTLDASHAVLQAAAAKADETSEQLAEDFCEKNLSLDEFLTQYIPSRKLCHMRRIKADKMGELLREGVPSSAGWPSHSIGAAPSPYHPGPSSSSAPYPMGANFGMPQPSIYRP